MITSTLCPILTETPIDLGCGFSYNPYIPKKRITVKKTQKGSFTQKRLPLFLHGEEYIEWSITLTTSPIAKQLYELYNLEDNFNFKGAYGDEYLVEFSEITTKPKCGFWEISGKFRVLCLISDFCPDINCETPIE